MKFFTSKLDYQILSAFLIGSFIGLIGLYIFDSSNSNSVVEGSYDISSNSYNSAVKKAAPAVVNIYTEQISKPLRKGGSRRNNSIFGQNISKKSSSLGSGVIFSSNGYILTNQHVIGNEASGITIELLDGSKTQAKVVGIDKETDLAVLKIEPENLDLPAIEIGNSDSLLIGDIVLAVGNPYGLGQSVSMGIISATGREFNNPYSNYLQTDASINKGNSGGALIDTQGKLIGINTLMRSSSGGSEGIGLAIPSVTVLQIINDLIQFGEVKRGWLGFSIDRKQLVQKNMLVIEQIVENGPANKGGIKAEDRIIKINDVEASYSELFKEFARLKPGNIINLSVLREDEVINIKLIAESNSNKD
ncbi:trypsin-like peptidase domain-containing protein [bacterium]|nr:trypsin-like peptidase domain-containing protein [bacterium]